MKNKSDFFFEIRCITCVLLLGMTGMVLGNSGTVDVIPAPAEMKIGQGHFALTAKSRIVCKSKIPQVRNVANYLADHLNIPTGYKISIDKKSKGKNDISLVLNSPEKANLGKEGYELSVKPDSVTISANGPAGLFYAVQTLLQLLPSQIESDRKIENTAWVMPAVDIIDYPRFQWRGLLLDVSRHFFTKNEVKRFIDTMARYKFNTFHWHLTDDQGWRIEIKKYPKLTKVGAWRVPRQGYWKTFEPPEPNEAATYGGFYTQDDIRQIVAYAASRFITIVPEIDVPGHSMAALAAHPELSCGGGPFYVNPGSNFYCQIENTLCPGNEKVYEFLDGVFAEVAELFDGQYIHIGGDEAYKGFWEKCTRCQKLKADQGLKDEHQLQSYFVKRIEKIVESKGKRLIGWDEILQGGLAPNATVMSWRGISGGVEAAKMGHNVVMSPSPYYYLDLYQGDPVVEPRTYGMNRLRTCYEFEPMPDGIDAKMILGVQGNLWSEEVSEYRHGEYMIWPRGLAIAEVGWSSKSKKNWPDFEQRIERQFDRLDAADVKYARSMFDVIFKPKLDTDGKLVIELGTEVDGIDIYYTFEGPEPDSHYPKYTGALTVPLNATDLRVVTYRNGSPIGRLINMPIAELDKRARK